MNTLTITKSNIDISKIRLKLSSLEKGLINKKLDKSFYLDSYVYYAKSEKYPAIVSYGLPMTICAAPVLVIGSLVICWYSGKQIFKEICNIATGLFGAACNTWRWSSLYFKHKKLDEKHFVIQRQGLKQFLVDIKEDHKLANESNSTKYFSEIPKNISESYSTLATFL